MMIVVDKNKMEGFELIMNDYRYMEVELTPEIFAELMILLYSNKIFERQKCIDCIVEYHLSNGGICNHKSYTSQFKKACERLRKKGFNLQNIGYSKWNLLNPDNMQYQNYWNKDIIDNKIVNENLENIETKEIGVGDQIVYVYYYPVYRKYAILNGKSDWECKIGMTTKNLWDRIYSQAATSFPEEPFIALIIKCDDAHAIELILHKILKNKKKWIEIAPGKEWFLTNPEEIETIYNNIK